MGKDFVKRLSLVASFWLAGFTLLAQGVAYPQQVWLQESAFNPAASGLFNTFDAYAGFSIIPAFTDNYGFYGGNGYGGQANFYLPKLSSGFGVSYNSRTNEIWKNWSWEPDDTLITGLENFHLNYNYQIQFKNKSVLSLGAAYLEQKRSWKNYYTTCTTCDRPATGSIRLTGVSLGAIYAAPKWSAGFSISPVFTFINETYQYTYHRSEYTVHGSYCFDGGKNTTITPYLYLMMTSGFSGYNTPSVTLGARLEHTWLLFALDVGGLDYWHVNASIGATINKQFSLIYTGSLVSDYSASLKGRHTFGVRYALGK